MSLWLHEPRMCPGVSGAGSVWQMGQLPSEVVPALVRYGRWQRFARAAVQSVRARMLMMFLIIQKGQAAVFHM